MTKATIVEKLLKENMITAEEAVVLLMGETNQNITYIPYYPPTVPLSPNPWYPSYPIIYTTAVEQIQKTTQA